MKYLTILSLIFLINCKDLSNHKNVNTMINKKIEQTHPSPIYRLNVETTSACKVYVNDIMIAQNTKGSMEIFEVINDLILSSGIQNITLIFENQIGLKKLELYRSNSIESDEFELIESYNKEIVSKLTVWNINIEVPYVNEGWSNSIDLQELDKNILLNQVVNFYTKFASIINDGDYDNYIKLFKNADQELNKSLFLSEIEISEENKTIINRILNSKGKTELKNNYSLKYYGNGKIVALEDSLGNSPIISEQNDFSSYWGLYLHIPQGSKELEIIR